MGSAVLARFYVVAGIVLLVGCGGGGSSSPPSQPVNPPLPPPPTASDPMAFTQTNSEAALELSVELLDLPADVLRAGFDIVNQWLYASDLAYVRQCSNGSVTLTLDDPDGNASLSAGDAISIEASNCDFLNRLDDLTGTLNIELTDIQLALGVSRVLGTVSVPNEFQESNSADELAITYDFEYVVSSSFTSFDISAGRITYVRNGETETVDNIALTRTYDYDTSRYQITGSADFVSESLPGSYSCVVRTLEGAGNGQPDNSNVTCDSSVSSIVMRTVGGSQVLQLDEENDGVFDDVLNPYDSSFRRNVLFARSSDGFVPERQFTPDAIPNEVLIALTDTDYSAYTDRVYVINQTGLVEIDLASGASTNLYSPASTPSILTISANGRRVFIGYSDDNVLDVYNLETGTATTEATLGVDGSGEPYTAIDVLELQGGSLLVAQQTRLGSNLVVYDAGVARPQTVFSPREIGDLLELENGRRLVYYAQGRDELQMLTIDVNGVTASNPLVEFLNASNSGLKTLGNWVVTPVGTLVDYESRTVIGRVQLPSPQSPTATAPDAQRQLLYQIGHNELYLWNSVDGQFLGLYRHNVDFFRARGLLSAGDSLVSYGPDGIAIFGKAELVPYDRLPCALESLSEFDVNSNGMTLNCSFNTAIYDPTRDLVFAAVQPSSLYRGGGVLQLNLNTGMAEEFWPTYATPVALLLRPNGEIYAGSAGTNRLMVFSPEVGSQTFSQPFLDTPGGMSRLKPDPAIPSRWLGLGPYGLTLWDELSQRPDGFNQTLEDFAFNPIDANQVLATSFFNLEFLDITSTGLAQSTELRLLQGELIETDGQYLYTEVGEKLDLSTLGIVADHDVLGRSVDLDLPNGQIVYAERDNVVVVDDLTGSLTRVPYPLENWVSQEVDVVADAPNHLVFWSRDGMVILPKSEIYP